MGFLESILGSMTGSAEQPGGSASGGLGGSGASTGNLGSGGGMVASLIPILLSVLAARAGAGGGVGSSGGLGGLLSGLAGGGGPGGLGKGGLGNGGLGNAGLGNGNLGGMLGGLLGGGGLSAGLGQLLNSFQQNGQGDVAQSWVGGGENRPIAPHQVTRALGNDTLAEVAKHSGLSEDEVASQLSQQLPHVVNKLTPEGRLPTAEETSTWV